MTEAGSGASQQRRVATHAPAAGAAPLCDGVEGNCHNPGGDFNMSNHQQQQQQYDAVLHRFSNLLCSAMATADDTKSLEGAPLATTRDLYERRSAALPRLFSEEVLSAAHVQLRAAQAAQAEAAANNRQQQAGRRNNNVDIMNIGSQDDNAGDDDSIWWLASAPSLDLRNKSKPLSSMLTRSLNMSPAISAAFNLSLPIRAVCGRVDDLGDLGVTACGTSTVAGSVLTNKTSLTLLPRRILQNVSASYKSLVDSRLRSSLSALLKRTLSSSTGTACGDSAAALLRAQTVGLVSLMSRSDAVVVTAAVSSFKVIDVPGGSTDEGLDTTGHLRGRTVPLIFEAVLDVIVLDVKTTAVLQAPGSLTGQFVASSSSPSLSSTPEVQQQEQESRLARVELTVDAPHLLQTMMEEARKAVRKAVSTSAANISATTTTNATNTNLPTVNPIAFNNYRAMARAHHVKATSSLEQAQKSVANLAAAVAAASGDDAEQQPPTMLPPQHNNVKRNSPLPRKVSDIVLRPGLKRKSSSFSSATPQSKSILPKPKRRSSAFSSTGSITDEEGSFSSYVSSASLASGTSAQQSSGGSDTVMPPPRPRSPLSKSRSSSRLLFYSGRKSSTQDGFASTAAAAAAHPGRVASSKSVNQNASWDHDDSRLSSSGSYSSSSSGSYSSSPGSSGNANANNGTAASVTTVSSANASAATAAGFALLSMKKTSSPKNKTSSKQKTDAGALTAGKKRVRSDQSIPLKKRIVSHEG